MAGIGQPFPAWSKSQEVEYCPMNLLDHVAQFDETARFCMYQGPGPATQQTIGAMLRRICGDPRKLIHTGSQWRGEARHGEPELDAKQVRSACYGLKEFRRNKPV